MLDIDNVTLRSSHKALLREISLSFDIGVTALLGANGAGKTSLIRMAASVVRPTSGTISWQKRNIWTEPSALREYRRILGWVPQAPGFPPRWRVEEFIGYAAWLKEIPRKRTQERISSALVDADLVGLRQRHIGALSGGEQRRVALAAALVGRPSMLLLDEPTAGLDPDQRERFLAIISRIAEQSTVVMATHLLEDVWLCADRVTGIAHGQAATSLDRVPPSLEELRAPLRDLFSDNHGS